MNISIQKIEIEKIRWGEDKGKYKGSISVASETTSIDMDIPKELMPQFIALCSTVLTETMDKRSQEFKKQMTELFNNLQPALPSDD
jgi:hypothetical protein